MGWCCDFTACQQGQFHTLTLTRCRLAATAGGKNKHTLVVSSAYELWVGNENQDAIKITGDIMGFHKGDFEERLIKGSFAV